MTKKTLIPSALLALALSLAGCDAVTDVPSSSAASHADEPSSTVVVTEADVARQAEGTPPTNNWVIYTRNVGAGVFRDGPASPPGGTGSFETTTPSGSDKVYMFNYDHIGTALSDIDGIGYWTYRAAGMAQQVTSLNVEIDRNGGAFETGDYAVLVFEPVYNTSQGTVSNDVWQAWDAYSGGDAIWWSSKAIPGVCAFSCYVTWDLIVAANPDAVILGGFGVNQGSGNQGLAAATDMLSISASGDLITYDFELSPPAPATPATKDDCKNGGWQTLHRADGSTFTNQGQCIRYVNTGR